MRFKRNCSRCGKLFKPTGKYVYLCDKCRNIQQKGRPKKLHPETKRHKVIICTQKHSKPYHKQKEVEK